MNYNLILVCNYVLNHRVAYYIGVNIYNLLVCYYLYIIHIYFIFYKILKMVRQRSLYKKFLGINYL